MMNQLFSLSSHLFLLLLSHFKLFIICQPMTFVDIPAFQQRDASAESLEKERRKKRAEKRAVVGGKKRTDDPRLTCASLD
jgi:hypothetical protein